MARAILISFAEVGTPKLGDRLERLRLLNGGRFVFAILLLNEGDSMTLLVKLQMEFVVTDREYRSKLTDSSLECSILSAFPSFQFYQPKTCLSPSIT